MKTAGMLQLRPEREKQVKIEWNLYLTNPNLL